jgi:hypothetical protein
MKRVQREEEMFALLRSEVGGGSRLPHQDFVIGS